MNRTYTLKKRAERQSATRRRIVEAAVDLHRTLGPARTPLSLVAERAGVQRKTLYAHFPDERSLQQACSGLSFERDPPPDAEAWLTIEDPDERIRTGLAALYGWYSRNAELIGAVLRDAQYNALTRETAELRFGPPMANYTRVLGGRLGGRGRAMLLLALYFSAWRILAVESGLDERESSDIMASAVSAA